MGTAFIRRSGCDTASHGVYGGKQPGNRSPAPRPRAVPLQMGMRATAFRLHRQMTVLLEV